MAGWFQGENGAQAYPAAVGQLPMRDKDGNNLNEQQANRAAMNNPFAGMGGFGGGYIDPYGFGDSYQPFADVGLGTVMQGFNTMQSLPNSLASQFGWVNALNSANQQSWNQSVAPIDIARGNNATELAKTKMLTDTALAQQQQQMPLLQALIQGLSGLKGGGMQGFQNTASRQMAQLPTGSSAQPVNFR